MSTGRRRFGALSPAILTLFLAACPPGPLPPSGRAATPRAAQPPRAIVQPCVVLVALDGVRWQEVFQGVDRDLAEDRQMGAREVIGARRLMPALHRIIDTRGAAFGGDGKSMRAHGPDFMSAPGYAELLTGRGPASCTNNDCPAIDEPTIVDEIAALPDAEQGDVAVIASWDKLASLAARDPSRVIVSAGRHGGVSRDRMRADAVSGALLDEAADAGAAPGHGDYRPDRFTAALALRYLETHVPHFLFIGLGDSDELAHDDDYRGYLDALRFADGVIARVAARLDEIAAPTLLVITTDHGRADYFTSHGKDDPESADVWLVVSGSAVRGRGSVAARQPAFLGDIAPTIRLFAGLPRDGSPRAGRVLEELVDPGNPVGFAP